MLWGTPGATYLQSPIYSSVYYIQNKKNDKTYIHILLLV